MKLLSLLNLDDKYIRHNILYFCHNHPSQNDNFNAALKDLVATLKAIDWPDVAGQQIKTFGQQNIVITNGLATIVVTKLNDGTHDIQASDIYTHLFDSGHVHFTKGSIAHWQLQGSGEYAHSIIDAHLQDIASHPAFPAAPVPIAGISLPGAVSKEGILAVGYEDSQENPLYFKVSTDGDPYWRAADHKDFTIYLSYFSDVAGQIILYYQSDYGDEVRVISKYAVNQWMGKQIQVSLKCSGSYPGGADLKFSADTPTSFYMAGMRIFRQGQYPNALFQASL